MEVEGGAAGEAIVLPPRPAEAVATAVGRAVLPPLEVFLQTHMAGGAHGGAGLPVVIDRGMDDWPAFADPPTAGGCAATASDGASIGELGRPGKRREREDGPMGGAAALPDSHRWANLSYLRRVAVRCA